MRTPWGLSDSKQTLDRGLSFVNTTSHGGFAVTAMAALTLTRGSFPGGGGARGCVSQARSRRRSPTVSRLPQPLGAEGLELQ
jgi:hypothetical protein